VCVCVCVCVYQDVSDKWVNNPLDMYAVGEFVRVYVLKVHNTHTQTQTHTKGEQV